VSDATRHLYAIAIGTNRAARGLRRPDRIVAAALAELELVGAAVVRCSATRTSAPLGPAQRCFGNAAAIVETGLAPQALLHEINRIERAFGRRRGRRWGDRPLDLDIILWSGGRFDHRLLAIPHREWKHRRFVADPLATIAPDWRDPVAGRSVRQIAARLRKR
jgi:2-amino-4-hydroxy-6-hydroxymethyldihydropteridine diphosphokinase